MGKVLKAFIFTLAWLAAAGGVLAAPGQGQGWRDGPRGMRQERFVERQGSPRYQDQMNYPQERRRAGPIEYQQYPNQNSYGNRPYEVGPDAQRRHGRLSPEERRALRRQINEAGRDIYAPYPPQPR